MTENAPSTSNKEAKNKISDHHLTKKAKAADMMKSSSEDGNTEEEEASIMTDFGYHDTVNAERYEKYFETVCKLLKPNSVIIIDNASCHSRNADNFPVSKWRTGQLQSWLKENKVPFRHDALRSELWMLRKIHRAEKTSNVIDNIARRYGHEVLRLPPVSLCFECN